MSTTIDERVVEMRFDNKQFESNVQTSLSTLDRLKKSLNLSGAAKGFDEIDSASKKVNMNGLANAVESVRLKFSALEVMAVTALANITNSALNAGKRIVSALTIDPIKTGFQEYETQIGAVQTILANTQHEGTNLQQVNRALDELNTYADKTIYNFTEMTRNIGTFTAAGVNLQTSVDSIKGIANLAAVSGSTSQQASTAMYQLSQALAAGKVSLMDWNSVVNAGMGGKVFQDALVRTSELLGTGAKNAINMYGSFRESLTKGEWLTTEVLTETLKQFAGAYSEADLIQQGFSESQAKEIAQMAKTAEEAATKVKTFTQLWDTLKESAQSGWTATWEILIGDFEEAKDLLSEVSETIGNVIGEAAQARNDLLSGGLSSGWKQLLNQGIADEAGYIESIQEVARKSGDAFDKMVADSDNFSDALKKGLQEGVISSDTLSDAVHNLRDKMTGMSQEERKAAGYTSEMVEQIEKLDEGIKNGSVSMDEFTEKILKPSGRENLIQSIWNAAKGLMSVIAPIKEAFRDIFPPMTSEQLYAFTEALRNLTERMKLSETTSENLKRTFKGLFAVLDIIKQAVTAVFNAVGSLLGGVGDLGAGILGVTGTFGDWLVKLDEFIKQGDVFNKVLGTIVSVIKTVATAIRDFVKVVAEKIAFPGFELFHSLLERLHTRMSQIGDAAGGMKSSVSSAFEAMGNALANCQFMQLLQAIWDAVKAIAGGIADAMGKVGSSLIDSIGNADFSGVIDLLNGISFGAIAVGITKFVGAIKEQLDSIGSIKESFIGILDSVRGCFEAYQSQLQAGTLLKIASAIAILVASLVALSLIDSAKLSAALGAITVLFADLMASMAVFNKISGQASGVIRSTTAMLAISTSVLILASALKKLGDLDAKQLATGLTGVAGLTATMIVAAKSLGKGGPTIIKGASQMVIFAAAIKVLASACEDLSALDWEGLAKGLVGVGVLLAEVSLFMNTAKFSGQSVTTATGIVILSGAIKILASACEDFAQMNWGEIGRGLTSIGIVLAEIVAFTRLTGNAQHVIATSAALIGIGAAMKILAAAVKDFSAMNWSELAVGLVGMAGALATVTIAVNFMPKNMIAIGTGLIAVSTALLIMASALENMGGMEWNEIAKGLVALGGSLGIMAVGLRAMTGTLSGSAAMLVAASALAILTPVLSILGAMSWTAIVKGLVSLAGAFTVIGVAGAVLTPLVPTILGLSGAMALIGVAVLGLGAGLLAAGTGLSAIAVGFTALAAAGTAGATAVVASLTVIITGIADLIPAIVAKIGEAIVEFCKVIANSAGEIGNAVKEVVLTLVDVLIECVPAIADGALKLIAGVLEALVQYTPQIVDSLFQFLIGVLEGIARNLPGLIQAAIDVLMAFFAGIVDALKGIDTATLLQGIVGIGLLAAIMAALSAVAALVPGAMVGVLGMGLVIAELALVLAAVGALAQIPGLQWLINEGGNLLQGVGTAIGKFIGGIVGGFMSGVSSQFPQIATDLSGFMTNIQPFIQGASAIDPSMMDGVKALAETILILTAANILEGLTSWFTGGSSLTGFAEELVPFGTAMKQFSDEIAGIDGEVVANAAVAGKTLAEMAATLPNSGGVVGFFAGENDMGAFGDQLVPFGEAMKAFADSVAGLDASVVTEAANAGKAMAEMASTIPNSGGVVGFFAGENDMDAFGEQLVPFGEAMKEFSIAVTGLNADVVVNSVTAGKALMELANTVPNSGGLVAFFTGENDLDMFGEKLVPFGEAMKQYSIAVTGLDANVVVNSANAAKALVELSNNLPNSGGIVSWFTGDNDIASFGEKLVSFGQSFAAYYASVSTVDVAKLSGVVAQFRNLVDLANGITSVDTSGMSRFAQDLTNLGNSGIEGFINAFNNASSRVSAAATSMLTTFINAANAQKSAVVSTFTTMVNSVISSLTSQQYQFTTIGSTMMTNFITGIRGKDSLARNTFLTMINGCLTTLRNKFYEFNTVGQAVMTNLIAGIRSKDQTARDTFVQIVSGCLTAIRNKYTDFYNAGKYLVEGFADGITANTYLAEARARAMAAAAARAAERELDEHSPSKVGYRIGDFFGLAFVNAISDYADKSYKAGTNMAAAAKNGLSNAISKIREFVDGEMEVQPTIRPVLDLSEVRSGAGRLTAILSRSQAMKISSSMNRETTGEIQNGDGTPSVGNSYSFVQNNYSPKALSRIDIYRQTKNQFSALKGLVET
ncbi:tape measure protein [Neglectibacter timonensis]|uniref:Tape measure protein n=1 Tax=Neglectibacter timonensis TaxID=1776382 RepID=A0ABT1S1X5_9FIRM|nr:tape measure protein [Neglectibacter timonensis]MCQ4840938.1 tape measure protein [Neglectibacter timonensis]MCQ4844524.1 tape measure protein [Neglectibacter timonensis]DAS18527.1 MAG TPA: tail tape measure [Caudoviricetes sp.]